MKSLGPHNFQIQENSQGKAHKPVLKPNPSRIVSYMRGGSGPNFLLAPP